MSKRKQIGPKSPVMAPAGHDGQTLHIIYGANAGVKRMTMLFNVSVSQIILTPDEARHMAGQLIHFAEIADGKPLPKV